MWILRQTDGTVPNTLVIANCEVVKPRVAAAEHISQVWNFILHWCLLLLTWMIWELLNLLFFWHVKVQRRSKVSFCEETQDYNSSRRGEVKWCMQKWKKSEIYLRDSLLSYPGWESFQCLQFCLLSAFLEIGKQDQRAASEKTNCCYPYRWSWGMKILSCLRSKKWT